MRWFGFSLIVLGFICAVLSAVVFRGIPIAISGAGFLISGAILVSRPEPEQEEEQEQEQE